MNIPMISIGVTTYNAEATISAALESALNQSYSASQIIVVDDASTDKTPEILATFCAKDPRFLVFINSVNSGVAVSRNRILEHASGEFIAFFDDDDISDPRRLELQLQRILRYEFQYANGSPVLCHTARKQFFPDGRWQIEPALGYLANGPAPAGIAVARYALMGEPLKGGYGSCATCSQMGRISTYRNLGGFNASLRRCEDFDFAIRFARIGGHFPGVAEPLVLQQMTPTNDKSLDTIEKFTLRVFEHHKNLFDSDEQFKFCNEWIQFKFSTLAGIKRAAFHHLIRAFMINPGQFFLRLNRALPNIFRNHRFSKFTRSTPSQ